MDKKMTKDEARAAAEEWADRFFGENSVIECTISFVVTDSCGDAISKPFPFEPPHPEKGTTCKFSNSDNDDWCIGQLKNYNLNPAHANHFQASNGWWYGECEPYTLIDPAEHAELKKRAAKLMEQVKATAEDIQPLRVERDRLRREVKRLQDETIDPEEHAKAKEAEAVLAELLPLCEEIIEQHSRTVWPMSEPVERLENLIK